MNERPAGDRNNSGNSRGLDSIGDALLILGSHAYEHLGRPFNGRLAQQSLL
ncbi:MAG: hypothetical protein KF726_02620 [Anaerolineae bacterium]|nr:hypothetical protein [Anaerolineae bacterium]